MCPILPAPVSRAIVPQLDRLASLLSTNVRLSLQHQVESGEQVAVYRAPAGPACALIIGPRREFRQPPGTLGRAGDYQLAGVIEITDDGERALPGQWSRV